MNDDRTNNELLNDVFAASAVIVAIWLGAGLLHLAGWL
jgi:hypothetical protein